MTDVSVLPHFSPCLWFLCFFLALVLWCSLYCGYADIGIFFMCVEYTDIELLWFEQLYLSVNVDCYQWMNEWTSEWMNKEKCLQPKLRAALFYAMRVTFKGEFVSHTLSVYQNYNDFSSCLFDLPCHGLLSVFAVPNVNSYGWSLESL